MPVSPNIHTHIRNTYTPAIEALTNNRKSEKRRMSSVAWRPRAPEEVEGEAGRRRRETGAKAAQEEKAMDRVPRERA